MNKISITKKFSERFVSVYTDASLYFSGSNACLLTCSFHRVLHKMNDFESIAIFKSIKLAVSVKKHVENLNNLGPMTMHYSIFDTTMRKEDENSAFIFATFQLPFSLPPVSLQSCMIMLHLGFLRR
jgi:hypothetical protein